MGCMDSWMHGCMAVCIHGCIDAWMDGCTTAWMPGCMAAWLHGCMATLPLPEALQTPWGFSSAPRPCAQGGESSAPCQPPRGACPLAGGGCELTSNAPTIVRTSAQSQPQPAQAGVIGHTACGRAHGMWQGTRHVARLSWDATRLSWDATRLLWDATSCQ